MAYLPDTGISAQKLASAIYRFVNRGLVTVKPGEMVNQGLDGGKEFSFTVESRDGRVLLISVIEEKEPEVQAPYRPSQAERVVAARRQREADQQRRFVETRERRRLKWLGSGDIDDVNRLDN